MRYHLQNKSFKMDEFSSATPVSPSSHTQNVKLSLPPDTLARSKDLVEPQGIFVHGTLIAEEFLSWLLTGSSENYKAIISPRQPAILTNYRRVALHGSDCPALITGTASDAVEGFLITPACKSQWKKMDDSEGENYRRHDVHVHLKQCNKVVPAHAYLWQGSLEMFLIPFGVFPISGKSDLEIGRTFLME